MPRRLLLFLAMIAIAAPVSAQNKKPKKTRDMLVREDREVFADSEYWIYNDLPRAMAEAKRTGKPLFAVVRCVP